MMEIQSLKRNLRLNDTAFRSITGMDAAKIDWLSRLDTVLEPALRSRLWLLRERRLSSGETIMDALIAAEEEPEVLAPKIKQSLEWRPKKLTLWNTTPPDLKQLHSMTPVFYGDDFTNG